MGVKDAAEAIEAADEGGGPAGVVEGWSTLRPNAALLELLSGVAGEEEPNSDQRKDMMMAREYSCPQNQAGCATETCALWSLAAKPNNVKTSRRPEG